MKLCDYKEAIKCFDRILRIIPNDYFSLHFRGISLRESGELQESIYSFNEALNVNENMIITLIDNGDTYKEMGNTEKSIECYDKALRMIKKDFYEELI